MNPKEKSGAALVGAVLEGGYRIEALIGEGGMGAVYTAMHLRLDRRVAIKVMGRDLTENEEALLRFNREAQVTSGLGHPHIVQVFDFSTMPTGEPFMVMEYLEGEDLAERLRREQRLLPAQTLHIVKQVASALSAAHAKGIVHRDLKPGNVFLMKAAEEADFVKVLDFGISKVRAATTKLTRAEAVMGTPDFMSPEQALGQIDEIDERTDQWALACMAWQCLSGRPPFIGVNAPSLLFQVVHEQPGPLTPQVPGLPAQAEQVLRRALAKKKAERFPSVSAFAGAFEKSMAGIVGVTGEVPLTSRTEEIPSVEQSTVPDGVPPVPTAKQPTTFSQTAGELGNKGRRTSSRPRWLWPAVAVAAGLLLVGSFVVARSRPTVAPERPVPAVQPAPPAPVPETKPPPLAEQGRGAALAPSPGKPARPTTSVEAPAGQVPAAGASTPTPFKGKGPPRRRDASKQAPRFERKLIEDL